VQQRWWRLQRPREGNVVAAAAAAVRVLRPVAEAVQPPAWRPGPRSSNAITRPPGRARSGPAADYFWRSFVRAYGHTKKTY
jgi:hypothetical protein